jgi:hypothetical protein
LDIAALFLIFTCKIFMKKNICRLSLLAVFVTLFAACSTSYAVREKPEEVIYLRPAPPSPDHVWISGDWIWNNGKYVWHEGHYEIRRPEYRWIPGQWLSVHGGWIWLHGRWRRY